VLGAFAGFGVDQLIVEPAFGADVAPTVRVLLAFLCVAVGGAMAPWVMRRLLPPGTLAPDASAATKDLDLERLRLAIDVGRQGIWDYDLASGQVVVSAHYARMLGFEPSELHESFEAWRDRLHPEDREPTMQALAAYLDGRQPEYRAEFRQRTKSGAWKWIQSIGRASAWDAERRPVRMNGMHTDITALKEAEARVARYTKRAQGLLDLPRVAELMTEKEFMQHGQELIEELTGSTISFTHFVHEDEEAIELVTWSRRTLREYCTAVYDSHYPISQAGIWADAFRMRRAVVFNDYAGYAGKRGLPEGHARLDRLISCPVIDGGKVRMLTGVGNRETEYSETDVETVQVLSNEIWRILKRRREEAVLRASEERYRRLFEGNPHPMWVADPSTLRFVAVNAAAIARYGYTRDEFLAMTISDLMPPEDLAVLNTTLAAALGRRLSTTRVWRHRNKYGTLLDVDVTTHEMDFDGRRALLQLAFDVTDQRRAEAAIAESEDRLRVTTAVAGLAVWEFDAGTGHISRSAMYDQLHGLPWQGAGAAVAFNRRIHPDDLPAYKTAFEQATSPGKPDRFRVDYRVVWPDLSVHWLECSAVVSLRDALGNGLKVRGVLTDITARKVAELELLGRLTELSTINAQLERRLAERDNGASSAAE
jgi:PAS domain S-box-containing protein